MKVSILAGGKGERLGRAFGARAKAMIDIGEAPVIVHLMRHFRRHGHRDFLVALGHRGEDIKRYFHDRFALAGDLSLDFAAGRIERRAPPEFDWRLQLIETGAETETGGRVRRLREYIGDETFILAWCDGISDVDLGALIAFHQDHGKLATVTAVRRPARFGILSLDGGKVAAFAEKPETDAPWINGAFFVLEPAIFNYIAGDATRWEQDCLVRLAAEGELMAYRHDGYWRCMDTPADVAALRRDRAERRGPWNGPG